MTVLTDRRSDAAPSSRPATRTVTALVHVDRVGPDGDAALTTTLGALATGVVRPDHILVLDASESGTAEVVCRAHRLAEDVDLRVVRVEPGTSARAAYGLTAGPSATVPLPG